MELWQQVARFFIWPEAEYLRPQAEDMLAREARRYRFFGWLPWFGGLFADNPTLFAAYQANDTEAFAVALRDVRMPVAYQQIGHLRPEDAGERWHTSADGREIYYGPGPVDEITAEIRTREGGSK